VHRETITLLLRFYIGDARLRGEKENIMAAKKKATEPVKKAAAKKATPVKKAAPAKKTAAKKATPVKKAAAKKLVADVAEKVDEVKAEIAQAIDEVTDALIWADTAAQQVSAEVKKLPLWKRLFGRKS